MRKHGMFKALICGETEEYSFPFIKEKYLPLKILSFIFLSCLIGYLLIYPPVAGQGIIDLRGDFKIEENADKFGMTRLHRAVIRGKGEIIKLLIRNGTDPDSTDNYGWSSLHWSNFLGRDDLSEILVKGGASEDIRTTSDWYVFRKGCLPEDLRRR